MIELLFLIIIVIIALVTIWYFNKNEVEFIEEVEQFTNYLQSCPSGFTSFYNQNSDMICCDGQILANKCLGNTQCILNGNGTNELPNCVNLLQGQYKQKGNDICPLSMPEYFEDTSKKTKGCTNGPLNQTMTGPKSSTQPSCVIYSDWNQNMISGDSCYNHKKLDNLPSSRLIQPNKNGPPLVMVELNDNMGISHIAYTRDSLTNYLNALYPNWKEQGLDLSKNIMVAEVAKAVYIDKTMSPNDIQV